MSTKILDTIDSPADLDGLTYPELEHLAFELRAQMVAATSLHGGHLASSLGAVEITLALHRVLDCPEDRIIFDVGHQAYAHKLLTGRRERFGTLRTYGGISGFPKRDESPYDSHDSGHASDSLSTALGYAMGRDLEGRDETIAVVIGDASFTGGMAFEALNQIGHSGTKMIIILNDNGMSISSNVGGFASYLGKVRMSDRYTSLRDQVEETVSSTGKIGKFLMDTGNVVKESVKQLVLTGGMFFEEFGVTYVGPIDGHDIPLLEQMIRKAKDLNGPVLIHAVTTKGKGYEPAEKQPDVFHGVGPFDIVTGKPQSKEGSPSWTSVFSQELMSMAEEDPDIIAVTAAMSSGTGLDAFHDRFPDRCVDVGIAEEHAVTFASALALAGKKPVVAIYSTFLQRAYDQIMTNVALQKQHVVFCLDRAGLVGEDGPTHHGAFDLSYMRTVPGMSILAPSDDEELRDALRTAVAISGPVAIRYPRGTAKVAEPREREIWQPGVAVKRREGSAASLLAVGSMVDTALEVADILATQGIEVTVYDMRWVKPIDAETVKQAASRGMIFTLEENSLSGGFGSGVLEVLSDAGIAARVERIGLPDRFVTQGPTERLIRELGLDAASLARRIGEVLAP